MHRTLLAVLIGFLILPGRSDASLHMISSAPGTTTFEVTLDATASQLSDLNDYAVSTVLDLPGLSFGTVNEVTLGAEYSVSTGSSPVSISISTPSDYVFGAPPNTPYFFANVLTVSGQPSQLEIDISDLLGAYVSSVSPAPPNVGIALITINTGSLSLSGNLTGSINTDPALFLLQADDGSKPPTNITQYSAVQTSTASGSTLDTPVTPMAVPEPATLSLVILGLALILFRARWSSFSLRG